jgi:hypothetical protein
MGKGKIIYCGVDPEKFKGHYFMMKAFRLWSVLFCSLGVPAAPDYNGVAWYRFDIDIPKDLKGTEAVLNMGVIDDYDTTFFNGVKIGGLGKEFGIHVYTAERAFSVPGELINWGGRNNITVRVEDNAGDGGIVSGKPRLEFLSGSSDGTDLYIKAQGIHEVFGVTPYYNEQW